MFMWSFYRRFPKTIFGICVFVCFWNHLGKLLSLYLPVLSTVAVNAMCTMESLAEISKRIRFSKNDSNRFA